MLRRILHAFIYHGWLKHGANRHQTVRMLGFTLHLPPTVFDPRYSFSSRFLASEVLGMPLNGMSVLEVGCGSGIVSLAAGRAGGKVVAIDVNPAAVAATRQNARENGLESSISVLEIDLMASPDAANTGFDFLVCNPPYFEGEPASMADRAFKAGNGFQFFSRLALEALTSLQPDGKILLVLSTDTDISRCLNPFADLDYGIKLNKIRHLPFETLALYELSPDRRLIRRRAVRDTRSQVVPRH